MHSHQDRFATSTSHGDYRLGVTVGTVIAVYAGFFLVLYWLMQPTVSANAGLAAYRPPPKTVVKYADAPWVPPDPAEALPFRRASDERPPIVAKTSVTEEPKKEVKKPEKRTAPRQARPVQQQPNSFWGFASSSRSSGSRPWF